MKRIEIIVGQYPNQISLDLSKDSISIALQYSIDDVRNIDKKNSNYSKTIRIPGTKKNNDAFGNLFDVNSTFDLFNPNKKSRAIVLVNSTPVLEGYLQLRNVVKLNNIDLQGNHIEYEAVIFDDSIDFLKTLGDKKVRQLDISDFNHTYNKTNIINAWNNNNWEDMYQYPLLDKNTKGYITKDFKPAFYHKALLIRIAQQAGYTLEGTLFDDPIYEREIIAWDGNTPKIDDEVAEQREWKAGFDFSSTGGALVLINRQKRLTTLKQEVGSTDGVYPLINANYLVAPDFYDNLNQYDEDQTDGYDNWAEWNVVDTGKYNLRGQVRLTFKVTGSGLTRYGDTPGSVVLSNPKHMLNLVIQLRSSKKMSGSNYITTHSFPVDNIRSFSGTSTGTYTLGGDISWEIPSYSFTAGDKVIMRIGLSSTSGGSAWTWTHNTGYQNTMTTILAKIYDTLSDGSRSYWECDVVQEEEIDEGEEIEVNQYLPKEIYQKDILTDVIRRYNVYVRKHPSKTKTLILDSRDNFYSGATDVIDWTQKKDYNTQDKIQFLSELQQKEILFTYKEANDIKGADGTTYNKEYKKGTGDIYGQKLIGFDNDFVVGKKKIESIFSTVPTQFRGSIGNNVVVPTTSVDEEKRAPVLLYWGGMKKVRNKDDGQEQLEIKWGDDPVQYYTTYPYAGHWDDPYTPTIDIHYGEITYEFYEGIQQTTANNLFNRYWRNYYNQIVSGRLVTSKFYLRESDISYIKDRLNTRIFVKDTYFIINKIVDYKPLEDSLTTVELLRIEEGSSFTPDTNPNPLTSYSPPVSTTMTPTAGPFVATPSLNTVSSPSAMVIGTDNYVAPSPSILSPSVIINGSSNSVGSNSENVNINGNFNFVDEGINNVLIVGDYQTIEESNSSIIEGSLTLGNTLTVGGTASFTGGTVSFSSPVVITGGLIIGSSSFTQLWEEGTGTDSIVQPNSSAPNTASNIYSITTGVSNTNDGQYSGMLGGASNTINTLSAGSVIDGGSSNNITGDSNFIGGGSFNTIVAPIGGTTTRSNSAIISGGNNNVKDNYSVIVGGNTNLIEGGSGLSSIVGGSDSELSGTRSVILGGNGIIGTQDDTVYIPSISFGNEETRWIFKELEIGDWDMDTTNNVDITHSLTSTEWKTIRSVDVIIKDDVDTEYKSLLNTGGYAGQMSFTSTLFKLQRTGSGIFDNTDYSTTPYNRGYITFWYKPD